MATEAFILKLAEEFLGSAKGKKIFGQELPTAAINKQIQSIATKAELTESELRNLGFVTAAQQGIEKAKKLGATANTIKSVTNSLPSEELRAIGLQYARNQGIEIDSLSEEDLVAYGKQNFESFVSGYTDDIDFANLNIDLPSLSLQFPELNLDLFGEGLSREERAARRQRRRNRRQQRRDDVRDAVESAKAEIRALIRKQQQDYTPTLKTFVISGKVYGESVQIEEKWKKIDENQTLSESEKRTRKLEVTTSETDGSFGGVRISAAYLQLPDNQVSLDEQLNERVNINSPDPDYNSETFSSEDVLPVVNADVREINPLDLAEGVEYFPYPNMLILPPYRSDGSKFMDISLYTLKLENLTAKEIQALTPKERREFKRAEGNQLREARREERKELQKISFDATTSPIDGSFNISIRVPVLPVNERALLNLYLVYTKPGHVPKYQPILNRDRTVKSDLSTVKITSIDVEVERAKLLYQNASNMVLNKAKVLGLSVIEAALIQRRKSVLRITNIIKRTLFPVLLGLLIEFGITSLIQSKQKTCPTPSRLKDVIKRRNKVVRQLNNIYKGIAVNTGIAAAALVLGAALKSGRISIQSLPIPQAIGIPPAKDFGGLISSQTTAFQNKFTNIITLLKELEEQNKELNRELLVALLFAVAGSISAIALLNAIDKLSQECTTDDNLQFEALSQELIDLTQEQEEDGEPIISSINGFELAVETEANGLGDLKRRFAVAKDSRGITLLKGEPSFSSVDQILIDELVFYIQQNDLKAV